MGIMIQTAVLVIAILAVRELFGEKLHAYIRYGLWLLVVLRLLVPVNLVDSSLSVLHIGNALVGRYAAAPDTAAAPDGSLEADSLGVSASNNHMADGRNGISEKEQKTGGNSNRAITGRLTEGRSANASEEELREVFGNGSRMTPGIFRIIWIAGIMLVGGFLAAAHLRFRSRLRRMRKLCRYDESGERSLHNTRSLGRKKDPGAGRADAIRIYQVSGLEAPCLVGFICPAIYVGADVKTDTDYFRYIVAHERVHYLHGDHIWALLRIVLVAIYWFHPFVWIAALASARDGEIACDYGTVLRLGEKERLPYGTMLLDISRASGGKRIYSYGTMLRPGRSEIKERVLRLAGGRSRMSAGILVILFMVIVAGCAFTGASRQTVPAGTDTGTIDAAVQEDNGDAADQDGSARSSVDGSDLQGDNFSEEDNTAGNANLSEKKDTDNGENFLREKTFNPEEEISEARRLTAVSAALSEETIFGADGPSLDYAGKLGTGDETIIIFHDYFGLVVYDLTNRKVLRSLDLAHIDCHMTQGDNVCQVRVSADGTAVWLHPGTRQYMFRYEPEGNLLYQLPIVKSFDADLETEDLFDRYLATEDNDTEWHSNYLYEEYKDEKGVHTAYIYLYVPGGDEQRLRALQCVWDDMVYVLCDQDGVWPEETRTEEKFPYRYDGAVEDVMILYDEPCAYTRISAVYESRVHPVTGDVEIHEGIDYAAEEGTEITAAADGVVYAAGRSDEHGIYVVLLHTNGDMTYYCHCREVTVKQGDQVERGERIAAVGNTGRSTGAHLHFALSRDGAFVDPAENMP